MGCCHSAQSNPLLVRASTGDEDIDIVMKTKRRVKNVFNEQLEATQDFTPKFFPKSQAIYQLLDRTLTEHAIFSCFNESERKVLINAMEEYNIRADEDVIRQGDEGDYFYIVEHGSFSFIVDDKVVGQASDGSCFGELALMYNTPRAATVHALKNGNLWRLDRLSFRILLARNVSQQKKETAEALSRVPLLQGLTSAQLHLIADAVQIVKFHQGKQIIEKDTQGDIFYMIINGEVQCTNFGKSQKTTDLSLGPNDYFGERALLTKELRAADVFAKTDVTLMALDREAFVQLLGPLSDLLDRNMSLRVLKTVEMFRNMSDRELEIVAGAFKINKYSPGTKIIQQDEIGNTFYIIKTGTCQVTKNTNEVATLGTGDYFGEMALLNDEPRLANVSAIDDVELFELERSQFDAVMGPLEAIMKREAEERVEQLQKSQLKTDIRLHDLKEIAVLGAGTFGRVTLVRHSKSNQVFALKAMIKYEIIRNQQQNNVVNEKNMMLAMDHPFVLKLLATFRDSARIYLLLELIQGGELFTVIHTETRDGVNASDSKFYGAVVLLGLKHMHERNIAYRDLKPENILVDSQGYCRIADFGFAKLIEDNQKTFTLCGTPEYLSPEIITQRGHNKAVDIWAFGILCYEMIAGFSPFVDFHNNDQMVLYRNILHGRLSFPKRFDPICSDLVQKILVRDQVLRLGASRNGFQDIMDHDWFQGTNWQALLQKEIKAPWIPRVTNETDSSNFNSAGMEGNQYAPDVHEKWEEDF